MTDLAIRAERPQKISLPRTVYAPFAILAAGFLLALWFGFSYSGLLYWLAEWQFDRFGAWYPMISVLSFCGLGLLLWRLGGWARRSWRKARDRWSEQDELDHRYRKSRASHVALFVAAATSFGVVLLAFGHWLTLPTLRPDAKPLDWNRVTLAQEGATTLDGAAPIGPIARYRDSLFGYGPDQYFAPIAGRRETPDSKIEYQLFAEMKIDEEGRPFLDGRHIGLLRRNALPGELVALYRFQRHPVVDKASVIFLNNGSSGRWSVLIMLEALGIGIIALIFGMIIQRRHRKYWKEA